MKQLSVPQRLEVLKMFFIYQVLFVLRNYPLPIYLESFSSPL